LLNSLGVGISVVLQEQPDWSKGDVEVKEATSLESEREPAMSFGM
jgi:hypothetical protein